MSDQVITYTVRMPDGSPINEQWVKQVLNMADQFLCDWQEELKDEPDGQELFEQRTKELAASRALLEAAPALLTMLQDLCNLGDGKAAGTVEYPDWLWARARELMNSVVPGETPTGGKIISANLERRVVILMDGGRVDEITSSHPMKALVLDYDVEGADAEEVVLIPQNGRHKEALLSEAEIFVRPAEVAVLYEIYDQEIPT